MKKYVGWMDEVKLQLQYRDTIKNRDTTEFGQKMIQIMTQNLT